jgi:hypothetical protein
MPLISLLIYLPTEYGIQAQIPAVEGNDSQYYVINGTDK